ncbi:MAG: rhombosortase [Limnobacter sp.]|nr:rhombosortase [Limnobacter sp.]
MKIIGNYNAQQAHVATYLVSIGLLFPAFVLQMSTGKEYTQGIDLTESFFVNVWLSQFAHLGWNHLLMNAAGLALITWGLAVEVRPRSWVILTFLSLLATPFWLVWVEPLDWYCGLSGALHAQFTSLLIYAISRSGTSWRRNWPLWLMMLGLVLKLGIEALQEPEIDSLIGGTVAVQAHRAGTAFGLVFGLLAVRFNWLSASHNQQHP